MPVVVVLPCVPATATPRRSRIIRPSSSARLMTGMCARARFDDFGIALRDGRRDDDQIRADHVFRAVADGNLSTSRRQAFRRQRSLLIRAAHGVTFFQQNLGNRRKARSADANQVYAFLGGEVCNWAHLTTSKMIMNTTRNGRNGFSKPGGNILRAFLRQRPSIHPVNNPNVSKAACTCPCSTTMSQ